MDKILLMLFIQTKKIQFLADTSDGKFTQKDIVSESLQFLPHPPPPQKKDYLLEPDK